MAPEITVNVSAADHIPLCYELDKRFYILINSTSTACVLLYVFLGCLSVVNVCGNLFIIISIIYFKQLHTPTNSLILSLAVADLLVGLLVFPFNTRFTVSFCLDRGHLYCKLRNTFDVTLSTASILNLCCISIDRYYAVCQPLTYRAKMNFHVVGTMILMTWTVSVLVSVGFLVSEFNYEKCEKSCLIDILLANILGPILAFYVPVIIMLCIYLKIFLVAQRQACSIQNKSCQMRTFGSTVSKLERKATKTLATVLGVFLMCWTPFFLCFSFQLLHGVSVPDSVFETLNWFALSNSMLNPFIYAFFYSWFRAAFKIIVSGKIFQGDFGSTKLT
ncbi:trace amine-associated receptor 1-like [Betta splendens]|uniref:Trace amine-associated receptor 1-like n=1 Tax=Betta splendens TaxID=158456 RepID=A0A9W2XL02_BETSP|nr:trace amine-associated receptor 1-like [Betta splendens]